MNFVTWGFFYNVCKEKNNEDIRRAKTLKACNSLYKACYFFTVTLWGYQVLKNERYLPKELFGEGDMKVMVDNYPT
jgi:hypothetical protein